MTVADNAPTPADALLQSLPPEWPDDTLREQIRALLVQSGGVVVSLDDDPTGVQTVHDIYALTAWTPDLLQREFAEPRPLFAVLTNSRAGSAAEAAETACAIAEGLADASRATGRPFAVISRSDSTLRGHFPTETDALTGLLGPYDATLLIPAFFEGGRITVDDVHLVRDGDHFVPAALTEFARDRAFGYSHSDLRRWIEEKTAGRVRATTVASLNLETIRGGGPDGLATILRTIADNRPVVVNAVTERDLEVVTLALLRAEAEGKRFLYRTAASFLRTRAGIAPRPPLRGADLLPPDGRPRGPGLIVAGSYVGRTGEQLDALLAPGDLPHHELAIAPLLDVTQRPAAVATARAALDAALREGRDAVLSTARAHVAGDTPEESLAIGRAVSTALVEIVGSLTARPGFVIAKGGITAHDLATHAFGARRILVLGQLLPGVPLWRLGAKSRHPDLLYTVFPGNVGGPTALREGYDAFRTAAAAG